MTSFTAVVTTGIYCRAAGCPGLDVPLVNAGGFWVVAEPPDNASCGPVAVEILL